MAISVYPTQQGRRRATSNPWLLALAVGLALLAVGVFASALVWRRRLVWLRRGVSVLLLISGIVVGVIWWNTPPPFVNRRAPLADSALVYATTDTNTITAYQAATGQMVWRRKLSAQYLSTFRVLPGVVVVMSQTIMNGTQSPTVGLTLTGLDVATGRTLWLTALPADTLLEPTFGIGVSVYQGRLYCAVSGSSSGYALISVDSATGRVLWTTPTDDLMTAAGASLNVAADANAVYVIGDQPPHLGSVFAYRASDGNPLWAWLSPANASASVLAIGQGVVYGASYQKSITALRATDGAVLWRQGFADGGFAPLNLLYQAGSVYVVGLLANALVAYAINAASGALRWRRDLGQAGANATAFADEYTLEHYGLVLNNGALMVNDANGLYALDAATGSNRWRLADGATLAFDLDSSIGIWTQPDERILPVVQGDVLFLLAVEQTPPPWYSLFTGSQGQSYLYAVSATTGQLYWRVQRDMAHAAVPPRGFS